MADELMAEQSADAQTDFGGSLRAHFDYDWLFMLAADRWVELDPSAPANVSGDASANWRAFLLNRLAQRDIGKAMAVANATADEEARMADLRILSEALAQTDLTAALKFKAQHGLRLGFDGSQFHIWDYRDARKAISFLRTLDPGETEEARSEICFEWARRDPRQLIAHAEEMKDDPKLSDYIRSALSEISSQKDPFAAISKATLLEEEGVLPLGHDFGDFIASQLVAEALRRFPSAGLAYLERSGRDDAFKRRARLSALGFPNNFDLSQIGRLVEGFTFSAADADVHYTPFFQALRFHSSDHPAETLQLLSDHLVAAESEPDAEAAGRWRNSLSEVVGSAARALISEDPAAAIKLAEILPEDAGIRASFRGSLAAGLAVHDPDFGLAWIESLPEAPDRDSCLTTFCYALKDPARAAELVRGISGDSLRHLTILYWSGALINQGFPAAADWLAAASGDDPGAFAEVDLLRSWGQSDHEAALAWAGKRFGNSDAYDDLAARAVAGWANADPYAVSELMASGAEIPGGYDRAASALAQSLGSKDPQAALEWLGAIQDGDIWRNAATSLGQILVERARAGFLALGEARDLLARSGLPPDELARLTDALSAPDQEAEAGDPSESTFSD
ncbi:MAG: hypothetical protein R3F11_01900 [Verrucomicrobiales bacterium]